MKTRFFTLLLIVFLGITKHTFGQTQPSFETLIVNKWQLEKYEIEGVAFPPKENHEKDIVQFFEDHKTLSLTNGISQNGTWEYDEKNKTILIIYENIKSKVYLQVESISENNCILILEGKDEKKIKMFLTVLD